MTQKWQSEPTDGLKGGWVFLPFCLSFSLSLCVSLSPSIYRATFLAIYLSTCLFMYQNPHVLVTFQWMHNPLHLPHKTTSERPKCLRDPQFLTLLTSKCASRHNGVHFFDISTSKSAPRPSVFNTFDFEMCFAPQRRALFRHLNFQKCSETLSF